MSPPTATAGRWRRATCSCAGKTSSATILRGRPGGRSCTCIAQWGPFCTMASYGKSCQAHWRFGCFVLYPLVLTTSLYLLGAFVGVLCMKLVASLGAPALVGNIVGVVTGLGSFASMLWLTEPQTYLLYLCDDFISTRQFARHERRDWEERMEVFAGYVVDAVRDSDADEAIIVGHESGSFLAVDVLDRALTRDPQLSEHWHRVAAAHRRRRFPDYRIPSGSELVPQSAAAAGGRARHRLGRLPVAPRRREFLAVRSGGRSRHRAGSGRAAKSYRCRHQLPRPGNRAISAAGAGASSGPISSS